MSVGTVTWLLRFFNICNAALLGLACFYAFQITSAWGALFASAGAGGERVCEAWGGQEVLGYGVTVRGCRA